jgi:predicted AAA+ superfamily ATPase
VTAEEELRSQLLKSYYAVYVEEEVRREVMLRDLSGFARFVRLSAIEAGNILNYSSISQETGVSVMTIKSYYQILEDMFIGSPHRSSTIST